MFIVFQQLFIQQALQKNMSLGSVAK